MKIDTLREFLFLAKELNFSSTARCFFIDQSSLSKHILDLEKELETPLFLRDRHSVKLTTFGKIFVDEAKLVVETHDNALAAVSRARNELDSILKIGYLFGASRRFLPYACKLFTQDYPFIDLDLHSLEHEAIIESVELNTLDMGISIQFENDSPSIYEYHRIYSDSLMLVVPESHPFFKKDTIHMDDLTNETIAIGNIHSNKTPGGYFSAILAQNNVSFHFIEQINDRDSLPIVIQRNNCLALQFRHMNRYYGSLFKFIPIDGLDLSLNISAFWKKSKAKQSIMNFAACIDRSVEALKDFDLISDEKPLVVHSENL